MFNSPCPKCEQVMRRVSIPCPDKRKPNEFGAIMACAVAHFKYVCENPECDKPVYRKLTDAELLHNEWRNFDLQ